MRAGGDVKEGAVITSSVRTFKGKKPSWRGRGNRTS